MSDRVPSSRGTDPFDKSMRRGAFTHRAGEFGRTADYAQLRKKQPISFVVPDELRGVVKNAGFLIVSPLMLVVAWFASEVGAPGEVASDPSAVLLFWGILVAGIGFWQFVARSRQFVAGRAFMLAFLLVATAAISLGYVYAARDSMSGASVGKAERVIPYVAGSKRTMFRRHKPVFRHQRADGGDLEGESRVPPLEHGPCVTAQLIEGRHGFRWLRIVEQMPPRGAGQLDWPVRRADCFSDKPLASLV
ncbi:hypothetical protein LZ496_12245 [Sphingomonas sp. NSE70-1]|uniref:Uncharacterized protein n=1 Tax=Sphingomonas caseinilyticus TaxID=2908205 RepID=A0ABT0RX67_9SPHN|nr:hypothetical protein [Sphingomonas caseinilyticus]MCL6699551.1 hypothetical protein [Sphingomonas caseinilyticus]